jgi:phosphoribosyl-ATP pyrophosphohydrolase/phosphoribosyl-AMP cyclohydrolase
MVWKGAHMNFKHADIERLDFDKAGGLVPAIVQDARSGAVVMLGYMNRDALRATLDTGRVTFFSRSRDRLWQKGETSGNHLELVAVAADCDRDTLLVTARPQGPACHRGTRTCFGDGRASRAEELAFLLQLEEVIAQRVTEAPETSYTARLFAAGPRRVAQKVGEEGLEVALAGAADADERVLAESADLLYHLLVLLKARGLGLDRVVNELESRHQARGRA